MSAFRPASGHAVLSLLEMAKAEVCRLERPERERLRRALFEALEQVTVSLAAPEMEMADSPSLHQQLVESARLFMLERLGESALSSANAAAHCGVSVRSLQAAFAEVCGQSPSQFIREQRLLQCRQALRSPEWRAVAAADIARAWGFIDFPNFSRAYKARFGLSPRADRAAAGSSDAATSGR